MSTYKQVSYGSKGSDVTELQKLLNKNGATLDEDGIFGNNTKQAVKDYQQKNGLAADGIVGNNTWGALTKAQSGSPAASTPMSRTLVSGMKS
jgi:peptidoglycan hydrolase-like protein with peptidoglycan-binding domain